MSGNELLGFNLNVIDVISGAITGYYISFLFMKKVKTNWLDLLLLIYLV